LNLHNVHLHSINVEEDVLLELILQIVVFLVAAMIAVLVARVFEMLSIQEREFALLSV
jgi:hypothetical protein